MCHIDLYLEKTITAAAYRNRVSERRVSLVPSAAWKRSLTERQLADLNLGVLLAMASFHFIPFAPFLLENKYFVTLYVAEHTGGHLRTVHHGRTDPDITFIRHEQYAFEGYRVVYVSGNPWDVEFLVGL
jgi:hypothetical protein